METWLLKNHMEANVDKCGIMVIGIDNQDMILNNEIIPRTKEYTLLLCKKCYITLLKILAKFYPCKNKINSLNLTYLSRCKVKW